MDKLLQKQRNVKGMTQEELLKLNKDELVQKILKLEAHNAQLKNIISKNVSGGSDCKKKDFNQKPFNFEKCRFRRVLLQILYFGWDYQGLAVQEDSNQTIEHHLFNALVRTCLIENREKSQYHRCGRTDKGVSAFGQVISISLRSKLSMEDQNSLSSELPYCKMLNRLLPKDIRAVAWMPIPEDIPEFSARFDCKKRQYKYYFPRASLDIEAMRAACRHLVGSKDFRHLCKMDVGNGVTEFIRKITKTDIIAVEAESESPTAMYYLLVEGNAFLWHQIRCMMGVLLLIGEGREDPDVILQLLQVENNPRKPQYNMALDLPLNLFHCTYDLGNTEWFYDKEELHCVISQLRADWTIHSIKTTMIKDCLHHLEAEYNKTSEKEIELPDNAKRERVDYTAYSSCLIQGVKPKVYTPLMERETCSSLEERIDYYRKKRKLNGSEESTD